MSGASSRDATPESPTSVSFLFAFAFASQPPNKEEDIGLSRDCLLWSKVSSGSLDDSSSELSVDESEVERSAYCCDGVDIARCPSGILTIRTCCNHEPIIDAPNWERLACDDDGWLLGDVSAESKESSETSSSIVDKPARISLARDNQSRITSFDTEPMCFVDSNFVSASLSLPDEKSVEENDAVTCVDDCLFARSCLTAANQPVRAAEALSDNLTGAKR